MWQPGHREEYRRQWIQINAHNPTDPRQREYLEQAQRWYPLISVLPADGGAGQAVPW